ncbi:MAG: hypothetical protein M1837_002873 [Sclerophora amabilis]|nr:MAG: hypothetical protein M1837_002873 [Sclerophora amabilis]
MSAGVEKLEIQRFEISEVFCPDEPEVDVVFVHGLNGHPRNTWTSKNGVFWPAQLLPKSLNTVNARILVYGYNANVYAFGGKSATKDYIHEHAQTLVTTLDAERFNADASERPIIFVAHSLGGILVKTALNYASKISIINNNAHLRSIFVSTYGVIFLGTPHNGADGAKWGKMLESMCSALLPRKMLDTEPQLINTLKTQSETLQNINLGFAEIIDRFHMYFFHEAEKTDLGATKDFIVDQTSAGPILPGMSYAGIQATHSGMCKFESKNSPGYTALSSTLKRYSQEAPSTISKRWPEEHANRGRARRFEASQLLGFTGVDQLGSALNRSDLGSNTGSSPNSSSPDQSNQSLPLHRSTHSATIEEKQGSPSLESSVPALERSEPFFIGPSGFRPNSIFVGMKKELIEINDKLSEIRRHGKGTACVLLCCLSGGGKSHLARQYVYDYRKRYPGGIFWVRAKSKTEIAQGFWDIAQKAALTNVQDPRDNKIEQDTEIFIRTVKTWFEARQEWLLVFDGITIDRDEDLGGFQAFLPDSDNSSVILTSVDRSLEARHRLLNPALVRVRPLDEDEARSLLFKELHHTNPSPAEIDKATELVRKVERLPLAIHAIGYRVRATGEPLIKYHIKSYSTDPRLREPFNEIMEDLHRLQHFEARNLINILCFFGQHIPVEMVQLGIKRLRPFGIEIRAKDQGSSRDINTTFRILLKYALLERNDPNDKDVTGSNESFADTIDILKIHTVVQNFCLQVLKSAGHLTLWLGRAVKFYTLSFEEADSRIKSKEGSGLVQDYREYEIHGNRLMEHVKKQQSKSKELDMVRFELEKVLERVQEEIQKLTPGSSQETIERPVCRASIFDRTSSASDTGPETPRHDVPNIHTWGIEGGSPHLESPASMGPESALPKSVEHIPSGILPALFHEETGYVSDSEQPGQWGSKMTPGHSQSTLRPPASHTSSEEWQEVRKKPRDTKSKKNDPQVHRTVSRKQIRKQRGSITPWRNTKPAPSKPRVNMDNAPGSVIPHVGSPRGTKGGSDARSALKQFQNQNSPPGSGSSPQRPGSDIPGRQQAARPDTLGLSYANALAGRLPSQKRSPVETSHLPTARAGRLDAMTYQTSAESPPVTANIGQQTTTHLPTTVSMQRPAAHSTPPQATGLPLPPVSHLLQSSQSHPGLRHVPGVWSSDPDLHRISNPLLPYPPTPVFGRNPNPLPIEDISRSSKRHLPMEFRGHDRFEDQHQPYPMPAYPLDDMALGNDYGLSPSSDRPHTNYHVGKPLPQAYTSQPNSQAMSRDNSAQSASAVSVTNTEPARFPPQFSPQARPTYESPRDRLRDGAPLRKSPKMGSSIPLQPSTSALESMPRPFAEQDLVALGGWASPPGSGSPMSRSSSGPGIAVQGTFVQFGDQAPVDVGLANMRATQQRRENLQRAIDNGEFRRYYHGYGEADGGRNRYGAVPPGTQQEGAFYRPNDDDLVAHARRRGRST